MYTDVIDPSINYSQNKSQKLKKACDDFEALFLSKMFESMRESVPDGGLIKKNQGEQIFTQMLDSQIAQDFSKNQSTGLSDMLYNSMSKYAGIKDLNNTETKNTLDKNDNKISKGNNFPKEEKSTGTAESFLKLRQQLSGTNVASDMLVR